VHAEEFERAEIRELKSDLFVEALSMSVDQCSPLAPREEHPAFERAPTSRFRTTEFIGREIYRPRRPRLSESQTTLLESRSYSEFLLATDVPIVPTLLQLHILSQSSSSCR